jgi:hypothetical protein
MPESERNPVAVAGDPRARPMGRLAGSAQTTLEIAKPSAAALDPSAEAFIESIAEPGTVPGSRPPDLA